MWLEYFCLHLHLTIYINKMKIKNTLSNIYTAIHKDRIRTYLL